MKRMYKQRDGNVCFVIEQETITEWSFHEFLTNVAEEYSDKLKDSDLSDLPMCISK